MIEPGDIPASPGIYLLLIWLPEAMDLKVGALGMKPFKRGLYGYVGSAWGPGGLRARLSRHAKLEKPQRWHIDALTRNVSPLGALYWEGAEKETECLLARLLARRYEEVNEMGASDCACRSHLFHLSPGV